MSGYNLGNSRVRNLYNVVTADQIEGQSFWPAFKRAAALRHNVVHQGTIATKADAEAAVGTARALVAHLNQKTSRRR
jgi:hypothetical protein